MKYRLHTEWVNVLGNTVHFTSEYMGLLDILQVKDEYPHSIIEDERGKCYGFDQAPSVDKRVR